MITILKTKKYNRERDRFIKNNKKRTEEIIETLNKFVNNPKHPSLNTEKLGGKNIWTIRLSKGDRLFFRWTDETTILLLDIGPHDKYRVY